MCATDLGVNHVPYNVVQFQECAMEWGWGGVKNSIAVLEGTTKWGGGGGAMVHTILFIHTALHDKWSNREGGRCMDKSKSSSLKWKNRYMIWVQRLQEDDSCL